MNHSFSLWLRSTLLASLTSLTALAPVAQADEVDPLLIHTETGAIEGKNLSQTYSWQGIPYAEPSVGALRWHAPQPIKAWDGIKTPPHSALPACKHPHRKAQKRS